MMELARFDKWLQEWLIEHSDDFGPAFEVGIGDVPDGTPHIPYVVFTPITTSAGQGSHADPEEMRDYVFQLLGVGRAPAQARYVSDRCQQLLLGRDANYNYLVSMTTPAEVPDVVRGSRRSDSFGAIVKTGDRLFQVVDTYRLKLEA